MAQFRRARSLFVAAVLLMSACSDSAETAAEARAKARADAAAPDSAVVVTDDAGRLVSLPTPARRVISMIPAQTEVVKILCGAHCLVARTQWDTDPALAHLPSTGNALTPSVEWLAAQKPDLVIAWPDNDSRNVINQLAPLGIPAYSSRVESLADIASMIERVGTLLGERTRADLLNAAISAQLDSVRTAVAGLPKPTVLYALSIDPPMAAGESTFVGAVINAAGGTNVFADFSQLWPQVSLEEIMRRQPDVIFVPVGEAASGSVAAMKTRVGWRDLRAVKNNRVYEVDANLFHRPGATVGHVARTAAALLHPDAVPRLPHADIPQ